MVWTGQTLTTAGTRVRVRASVAYGTVSDRSWGGGCPGAVLITTASLNTEIVQHVSTLRTYNTQTEAKWLAAESTRRAGRRGAPSRHPPSAHHPAAPHSPPPSIHGTLFSLSPPAPLQLAARKAVPRRIDSRSHVICAYRAEDPATPRRAPVSHNFLPQSTKCNVIFLYFEYRDAFVMDPGLQNARVTILMLHTVYKPYKIFLSYDETHH